MVFILFRDILRVSFQIRDPELVMELYSLKVPPAPCHARTRAIEHLSLRVVVALCHNDAVT